MWQAGEGELLLFVHGSLCDYRYWQPQLAGLSKHYRCVAVSLTHYWPVTDTEPGLPFSWSEHADEVAEFIERSAWGRRTWWDIRAAAAWRFISRGVILEHVRTLTLADPGGPLQIAGRPPASLPETVNALRAKAAQLIEAGKWKRACNCSSIR